MKLMKKITVLVSDDHAIVRAGLRALLDAAEDIEVVGEANDGHESVRKTQRLQPEVVILDLAMPLLNGVEATRQITTKFPSTKVLILSAHGDEQHVQQAIGAGASGYLTKETAGSSLLQAIREVHKGNGFFNSPAGNVILTRLGKTSSPNASPAKTEATLTSRQMEILQLVAEGHANKQIAGLLFLSIKTVEKHRQGLMDTLNIHDTATLTRYAFSTGVVECRPCPPLAQRQPRWLMPVCKPLAPCIGERETSQTEQH